MINIQNIPGDFVQHRIPNGDIHILRRDLAEPLGELLHHPPHALETISTGKGATRFYPLAGIEIAVKEYHHGGLLAPLIQDYYIAPPHRAIEEMFLLAIAQEQGAPVLEPLGCAIIPVLGPIFRYRLITRREAGARNLLQRLRAGESGFEEACATALHLLHDAGIWHRDLNMANFIIGERGVIICDLDRGTHHPHLSSEQKENNLQRLDRSIQKQGMNKQFSMTRFRQFYMTDTET